jgi:hypothetical protein
MRADSHDYRLCLLVENEPLDEIKRCDRVFDRRMSFRTATLLDRPAEELLRPIVVKSVAKYKGRGRLKQAVLTNHAMHDGMVGRRREGRAQLYPRRGDAQGVARAGHCRAHARLESYLRQ